MKNKSNELVLVTGRSGCGKSTQLSMIWDNSNSDLELFLTSGRNLADAFKDTPIGIKSISNKLKIGKPIIVEDLGLRQIHILRGTKNMLTLFLNSTKWKVPNTGSHTNEQATWQTSQKECGSDS